MLRTIRLTAAIVCFTLITLLFLDFTGTLHTWFGWLAKIQFLPAVLALNIGVVLFLIVLTLLFGRIYCSVICPLGVFQDAVSWFSGKQKKNRFRYSPALKWLRYGVLAVFILALVAGLNAFVVLLAPYSAYGRMVSSLLAPVWQWGNNLLAYFAERAESYAFYEVDVWMKSLSTLIIAVITLIVLFVLAWRNGRTYCNTICPVGTVLGFISRYSIFKPVIDTSKCNSCGLCARNCKASCINAKAHEIDYSRCVACMDCLGKCKQGAIKYTRRIQKKEGGNTETVKIKSVTSEQIDNARRSFLSASTIFATSTILKAQEKKVDGGLAAIEDKKIPNRENPIYPPGSLNARNFAQHCTACQLCVSVCPTQVLRPSGNLATLMQPEMSYERGYCRPECAKCAEVCPTDAIHLTSLAEKSAIQIGHAVWIKENCVPLTDGMECGNCARHCPAAAIQMVASDPEIAGSPKTSAATPTAILYGCSSKGTSSSSSASAEGEIPTDKMTYRTSPTTGDRVSLLGYGCMRWPLKPSPDGKGEVIDQDAVNGLIDYAIAHGVNYFDTSPAYVQGFSEKSTGIALSRYPRDKYFIATKLSNFSPDTWSREASLKMYHKSFADLQVDYIDYMLLHGIGMGGMDALKGRYLDNGMLDFLIKEREAGRIRNLGFSYHGDIEVYDYLLSRHDEIKWDFVQIQLNYVDWKHAKETNTRNTDAEYLYGELHKRGIPSIIMEPLLGGRLSKLNDNLVARLKQRRPESSVASWVFRFAGTFPDILTVLSGMTYMEHLQDNLRTYSPLEPLTDEEMDFLEDTAQLMLKYPTIPCNDCKYCMPCPYGLDIPAVLLHYNRCVNEGNVPKNGQDENYVKARRAFLVGYDRSVPKLRQASHCIGCNQCVPHCPQNIDIPKELHRIDQFVEQLKQGTL